MNPPKILLPYSSRYSRSIFDSDQLLVISAITSTARIPISKKLQKFLESIGLDGLPPFTKTIPGMFLDVRVVTLSGFLHDWFGEFDYYENPDPLSRCMELEQVLQFRDCFPEKLTTDDHGTFFPIRIGEAGPFVVSAHDGGTEWFFHGPGGSRRVVNGIEKNRLVIPVL